MKRPHNPDFKPDFAKALQQGFKNAARRDAARAEIATVQQIVQRDVREITKNQLELVFKVDPEHARLHRANLRLQMLSSTSEPELAPDSIYYLCRGSRRDNDREEKIASFSMGKMGYPVKIEFESGHNTHSWESFSRPTLERAFSALLSNVATGLIAKSLLDPESYKEFAETTDEIGSATGPK